MQILFRRVQGIDQQVQARIIERSSRVVQKALASAGFARAASTTAAGVICSHPDTTRRCSLRWDCLARLLSATSSSRAEPMPPSPTLSQSSSVTHSAAVVETRLRRPWQEQAAIARSRSGSSARIWQRTPSGSASSRCGCALAAAPPHASEGPEASGQGPSTVACKATACREPRWPISWLRARCNRGRLL